MIAKLKELFSFSVTNTEHKNSRQNYYELVSCPLKDMICKVHHSDINNSFLESEKFRKEEDFINSIETLKIAFDRTIELMNHPCTNCAEHFRSTIVESLENIHNELGKKSNGFFGKKRFKSSYLRSIHLLKEFESKGGMGNSNLNNDNKKRFLGNYLN